MDLTVRDILDRYGPILGVMAMLALLVALLPGSATGGGEQAVATQTPTSDFGAVDPDLAEPSSGAIAGAGGGVGTSSAGRGAAAGASGASSGVGVGGSSTGAGGAGSGGAGGAAAGAGGGGGDLAGTACRSDGNMPAFSLYSPTCVPVFRGDNGGATHTGVSADTIKVLYYFPKASAATQAALRAIGADDPRPQTKDLALTLARYFNVHYETYARAVEIEFFESAADTDDDAALKADAVKIATEIQPFAVIGAADVTAAELAARGIMCICTTSEPAAFYQQNAPYVFSVFPALDEFYTHLAEYIGKRLAGRNAVHAGELPVGISSSPRQFGLIYVEGTGSRVDPNVKPAVERFEGLLGQYGTALSKKVAYTYDAARGQDQATNILSQMKAADVTTVACTCDPITMIFFTQAATQQQYFPEWLIAGTQLTDTTFFGRTYDQAQWANAFGISPIPIFPDDVSKTAAYAEYHHMKEGSQRGDEGTQINVREPAFSVLFSGIHNAGPNLTPQTFAEGLWNAGVRGGQPAAVRVKFTPESYTAIKDFVEIWWDVDGSGRDETGKDGRGTMMKANQAIRYAAGSWPAGDPAVFQQEGSVYVVTEGARFEHDADGHTHSPDERCRSCG